MAFSLFPVTDDFAAEVGDVDLSQPLTDEDFAEIQAAFWRYAVLIFPEQQLTTEQHLAFARRFGPLETSIAEYQPGQERRTAPEIADVSNLDHGNRVWASDSRQRLHEMGNRLWHTDSSFRRIPAYASLLYARSVPPAGGRTEFADCRAAYDALPGEEQQRLTGLIAEHCIRYSRARIGFTEFTAKEIAGMPPAPQPLVRQLPQTKRTTLYLASHAGRILDWPEESGRALIDQLIEHASQRQFVYSHRWRVGDLVMWDDRCTMHRGTEFDDTRWPRDVQRATVREMAPLLAHEST